MPQLWLAQYLCPSRHAICALAYDVEETSRETIEQYIRDIMTTGAINPWCGLCGSRDLRVEHGKLFTNDWTAARAVLRASETAQAETREYIHERSKN